METKERTILDSLKDTLSDDYHDDEYDTEEFNEDDLQERRQQARNESVLALDVEYAIEILLGCGGPTRLFKITFDKDGEPVKGYYMNTEYASHSLNRTGQVQLTNDEINQVLSLYSLDDPYLVRCQLGLEG